jgi:glutaconyl-CoA/methylmalonyl-CoA decarboxylase subunit gamma
MSKKLQVKVNGNPFDVEVEDLSGDLVTLKVNGKPYVVEFEETGAAPAIRSVQAAGTATPASEKPAAPQSVTTAAPTDSNVIIAPMPGVIMDISVKPGDSVTIKQPICALEAMKMKNIIRTTREGVIASVEVSEGQHVPYGAVIIRFA